MLKKCFLVILFISCLFFNIVCKEVNIKILCWEGYAKKWIPEFQKMIKEKRNIDVNISIENLSDPMKFFEYCRKNKADLISPSHNILKSDKWPLIKSKLILPINLNNIPNYKFLLPSLKNIDFVTEGENVYGIPYTTGSYGLAFNTEFIKEEPDSWQILWDYNYEKKYSISYDYADCNIYITAMLMGASYEELYDGDELFKKIYMPIFEERLERLAKGAYSLWKGTADSEQFKELALATTWGYAVQQANLKGGKWKFASPKEGTTLWVDCWCITSAVRNESLKKEICEEWINYMISSKPQVGVIRNWGVSPVVNNINHLLTEEEIRIFKVGDDEYFKNLSLWGHQNTRTQNLYRLLWEKALK